MGNSVLIVDDDPAFRDLARRMLQDAGLTVAGEAKDAESAVALAAALEPEGILIDIGLPDRDGLQLATELAGLPWRPRVLLTSSDPDAGTLPDGQDVGGIAFVAKADLPSAPLRALLGI
jgi:DNA-binding NarL/FixJ family response regulator